MLRWGFTRKLHAIIVNLSRKRECGSKRFKRCHPHAREVRLISDSHHDATRPSCDSPNTPRRYALHAGNVCCWSVKTRSVPSRHCRDARVSVVKRLRPCMTCVSTPSSPPPFFLFSFLPPFKNHQPRLHCVAQCRSQLNCAGLALHHTPYKINTGVNRHYRTTNN